MKRFEIPNWLTRYDFSVYGNYITGDTLQEVLSNFCYYLNEIIEIINEYTETVDKTVDWIKNEGVKNAVDEKIKELIKEGYFENIINTQLFGDLSRQVNKNKTDIQDIYTKLNIINTSIKEIEQKVNNLSDEFNTFKEFINNEMNNFKQKIEELINNKFGEIKEELEYINKIQEIDLRKLVPFRLGEFCSKKTRVIQGIGYNEKTNTFFISRVYDDSSNVAESFLIAEYDTSGRQLSNLVCQYGGHGTVFGVEPVYNNVTKGYDTYIWSAWDITNPVGQTTDYRVVRFKYSGVKGVEPAKTININSPEVEIINVGTNEYTLVLANAEKNLICLIKKGDGKYRPEIHLMSNLKQGIYNKPISKVTLNTSDMMGLQGACLDENLLYWRRGNADGSEDDQIAVYDWINNEFLYTLNLKDMSNPSKAGNEIANDFKEPEGMCIYQDPITNNRTLFLGSSIGEGNKRRCIIDCLSQNSESCPAVMSSTAMAQKIAITKPDGQCKDFPKNITKLADILEVGQYNLSSAEMDRMTDKPSGLATGSSWYLENSGKAQLWDKSFVQTIIRNSNGNPDIYFRWVRKDDVTRWAKINTTLV